MMLHGRNSNKFIWKHMKAGKSGKRYGILNASTSEDVVEEKPVEKDNFIEEGGACYYDPQTGLRKCE